MTTTTDTARVHCREEVTHPVTFEIAETSHDGRLTFQARVTLDGFVYQEIGRARATDIEALDEIAAAFAASTSRR